MFGKLGVELAGMRRTNEEELARVGYVLGGALKDSWERRRISRGDFCVEEIVIPSLLDFSPS